MNASRKKKLSLIVFVGVVLALVVSLVLFALRQNISLFYSPSQITNRVELINQPVRLGGMVVKNSIHRGKNLTIEFKLTDYKKSVTVHYTGILPDLFREEQGIVAFGRMSASTDFQADQILAKHDANYMPPEVRETLVHSNVAKNEAVP